MNKKLKLYIPIIIGAVIIIIALILIFSSGKPESNELSDNIDSSDTAASTPTAPDTTTDTNNMPPPVPPEPIIPTVPPVPIEPATPVYEESTQGNLQCTDSDGGLNYTVKGIVTLTKNGITSTYTDYCRHGSFEDYIMEHSCGDTDVITTSYKCVKGCDNNGACW